MTTQLVLDAMGGDVGAEVILEGITLALPQLHNLKVELAILGDEAVLNELLKRRLFRPLKDLIDKSKAYDAKPENVTSPSLKITITHAAENIEMEDSIRAIRRKPNATINVGCQLAAKGYRRSPTAFISAGHSGAVMASALLHMGRLPQVERPAIAVKLPTLGKDPCVLIDVGANVDCKPEQLRDFAVMGAIFAQSERKKTEPVQVAVLSNGEERKKGTELTRQAVELIERLPCFQTDESSIGQFSGYCEGKDLFKGQVDVVVTDGFVGNVVLKSIEGLGSSVINVLKDEAKRSPFAALGFLLSAGVLARFKRRLDYAEYGAAPLLGVAGYVFICHGRSNAKAIKNAILRAKAALDSELVEKLEKALKSIPT